MKAEEKKISGWGNFPNIKSHIFRPESLKELQQCVKSQDKIVISGNRRSYGDSSLYKKSIDMKRLNKILGFDVKKKTIKVEAGVILDDLIKVIVPKGFFINVSPGTKYVTVGGCVASNIHGKNHHRMGSFHNFILSIEVILASGKLVKCSPTKNLDLFTAITGGMGLIATIYSVELKLRKIHSPTISAKFKRCQNINQLFKVLDQCDQNYEYTVAWIDCFSKGKEFGRSVMIMGNDSNKKIKFKQKRIIKIPFYFPQFFLNSWIMRSYNLFYYLKTTNKRKEVSFDDFFYPLDSIHGWNKIYGRKGFLQYQFVIPLNGGENLIERVLKILTRKKIYSYLTILKKLKSENTLFSFPKEGYTLAMDFPRDNKTIKVLKEIDHIIIKAGGRINPSKDIILSKDLFEKQDFNIQQWKMIKKKYDPNQKFVSLQAKRLGLI